MPRYLEEFSVKVFQTFKQHKGDWQETLNFFRLLHKTHNGSGSGHSVLNMGIYADQKTLSAPLLLSTLNARLKTNLDQVWAYMEPG